MKKRIMSLVLVVVMLVCMMPSAAAAEQVPDGSTSLEEMDAVLIACSVLGPADEEEGILSGNTTVKDVIPLYSNNNDVVAFYVSFDPTGYAVVNNNVLNPTVIEFGGGNQPLIEDILENHSAPHIVYNNPTEVFQKSEQDPLRSRTTTGQDTAVDLYSYFPVLEQENMEAADLLNRLRQFASSSISTCGDGDFGFIDWDNMPGGGFTHREIEFVEQVPGWATTRQFNDIAENHCGAVAVTNLALYFAKCGYTGLRKGTGEETYVEETFKAVHKIVGDGPKATIADEAGTYFSNCGYRMKTAGAGSFDKIINATKNEHPCGVLLANGIDQWHWVVCVGYRQYESGSNYMRIVNGWEETIDRFYLVNSGSLWISATEYWIDKSGV